MRKILLILLFIVGCEELLDPDTTAPTVVITYPANSSTLTEATTVTIDVVDDGDIGIVKLLVDGIETYADSTAPYQFTWDVCVQSTGTHTLMAKADDGAGNQGQSDLLTFTIDANYDCDNICGGAKVEDNCGTCDSDTTNDCSADCNGDWGGSAYIDECDDCVGGNTVLTACLRDDCGILGGDNSPNTGTCDCEGTPNGTAYIDVCGDCIGETTGLVDGDTDLDGICNTLQGTVTDIDGNTYKTIKIGDQVWMAENLKTTKYINGNTIPNVTDSISWVNLTTGAYAVYDNNLTNANIYGNLYNWYAVEYQHSHSPLCMEGWKVPSADNFRTLVEYLGGESVAGGKMKESGTEHWLSPNTGATNESGFSAIPSGIIREGGSNDIGELAKFWSNTHYGQNGQPVAKFLKLYYQYNSSSITDVDKNQGHSIRCIKDQ